MAQNKPNRRSIRLKGYDYTQPGAYFITICTHDRAHLFGEVVDGEMRLNALGEIARQCWTAIPDHFPHAALDEFVIMPNHVHGIIWIVDVVGANNHSPDHHSPASVGANNDSPNHHSPANVGAKNFSPLQSTARPRGTSKTIGSMVRGFKIGVTKWARQNTDVYTVWQRNYYEHIIRHDRALHAIRQYIADNPLRWHLDRYNENAVGRDPRAAEVWRMLQASRSDFRDKPSDGGKP
ncbi:MAG: transposase [Caldilineae bacterium]|nr:MAG: transposase [Caldilineae bacterium]